MATCRKVTVHRTTETKTTFERAVAVRGSWFCSEGGDAYDPESSHFEPSTATEHGSSVKQQEVMTEIRLELSEDEASQLMGLLQSNTLVCRAIGEALTAVLDGGKNFATRRGYGSEAKWTPCPVPDMDIENVDSWQLGGPETVGD